MKSKRIGILMGGSATERDFSLRSGRAVAAALEHSGSQVVRIDCSGRHDPIDQIRKSGIDCAFLTLSGRLGEDGCIQGLLEWLGIPYTGAGVAESALASDRLKTKELLRLHNLPVVPYYVFRGEGTTSNILDCHGSFGYPVTVGPRRGNPCFGRRRAQDETSLADAVASSLELDREVVVERAIRGKLISVGLLNGRLLGALEVLPEPNLAPSALSGARRAPVLTERLEPADLSHTLHKNVLLLAERACEVVGVSGAVLVDLVASEEQNEFVVAVNAAPAMSKTSRLPRIAEAAGFSFPDLCQAILATARLHVGSTSRQVRAPVVPLAAAALTNLRIAAG